MVLCKMNQLLVVIFRSTPPSRPNDIRGGNVHLSVGTFVRTYVYVRLYVRPQKVFPI